MNKQEIIDEQLEFYRKHKAGCSFAAVAAKNSNEYEWYQYVLTPKQNEISQVMTETNKSFVVSTTSLIFPEVKTVKQLISLIGQFKDSKQSFVIETEYNGYNCFGIRLKFDNLISWVSGFGDFNFLPKTRQAPYTEITVRVKPRPNYEWNLKESPKNVIHLADMDMKGMSETELRRLWQSSMDNTEKILGHKPNILSAAKTTFAIPNEYIDYD